jgi:hypothetical protein
MPTVSYDLLIVLNVKLVINAKIREGEVYKNIKKHKKYKTT